MWDPIYAKQTLDSPCQRNRQWAGSLYHKALHPSPIHANIRSSQERHSILLHSHHHLAEPILLPSRHARVDLHMYPPPQNMGTFHSWPLPRYLQGHLCIFDNKRPLGCHDFDDSSPPRIVLADALETKNRHLTRLCDCDIVSGSPRDCGVCECAPGLITKLAHVWPASNVLSLASKSSEATIRHMILSLLLSGRKQFPLHLRPFPFPFQANQQTYSYAHFPRDAEIALGIICSCMPILPKFFRHLVPKLKSRVSSYRQSKGERVSSAASGGSLISPTTTPWERYDDSRRLQSPSPAPDIEMASLGQETSMDIRTTLGDIREHVGEMDHVVARDKQIGEDLENGLRR